ncbi:MAG: GNAT family N-acetyltransferase [Woeseiaceae bacterium]
MDRDLQIVDFAAAYAAAFESLNVEWLEKYFHVEEIDRVILSNPQVEVIDHGGHILFAKLSDEVVGTVALKAHDEGCFELTKMAVTASQQGAGIGRALMLAAIARFKAVDGKMMFLESHSSLTTAITLYQSAGFVHVARPQASDYARSDTYMVYQPDGK